VPAGVAWRLARREHPEINLYDDAVHPGRIGAYLIGVRLPRHAPGTFPVGSRYAAGLEPAAAVALQAIAWRTVSEEGRGGEGRLKT